MMKVYVVCGGWDYQGCEFDSIQVFLNEAKADEYVNELKNGNSEYDYVEKELMEVNE